MDSMPAARVANTRRSHHIHRGALERQPQETTGDALDQDTEQELLTMASQALRTDFGAQAAAMAKSHLRRILDRIMAAQMRRAEREIARGGDLKQQSSLSQQQIRIGSKPTAARSGIVRATTKEFVT